MRDKLGRQLRYDDDWEPEGKEFELTPYRLKILECIQMHGMLPSNYIHAFVGGHKKTLLNNLKDMRREWRLIRLVEGQDATKMADYQPLTYELDSAGETILAEERLLNKYTASFKGPVIHQLMTATATASIHLTCMKYGWEYLSQEQILADDRCTHKHLSFTAWEGMTDPREVHPDQLWGIRFALGKARFGTFEIERAMKDPGRYAEKTRPYDDFYRRELYHKLWGLPNMRTYFLAASEYQVDEMMKPLGGRLYPEQLVFKSKSLLKKRWQVPPVMYDLVETPWRTAGGTFSLMV